MTSLYYAPLNKRLRAYYNEVAETQIDINNDYVLNQQLLFDERMQRNAYAIFENQKKLTEKLKTESKNLNSEEFQKKLYLENPEIYYLPPSEKSIALAIEQPKVFALPPSNTSNVIVPTEVRQKIEEEQKGKPKGATPKAKESLTPISQLAEDATLRVQLKDYPLYEEFRKLPKHKGLPKQEEMRKFANKNNITLPDKASSSVLADAIIRGIADIKKTKGEGFKKFMKKNKYKKCKC